MKQKTELNLETNSFQAVTKSIHLRCCDNETALKIQLYCWVV